MNLENILNLTFQNNSVKDYILFVILLFSVFLFLRFFRKFFLQKIKKVVRKIGKEKAETFVLIIDSIKPPFYWFIAIYLSSLFIVVHEKVDYLLNLILIVWVSYQLIKIIQILIDSSIKKLIEKEKDQESEPALTNMGKLIKAVVWMVGVLFVLSNIGVNVTSVMAGLGIGGIAIAFALQNILSDLFSSFAIFFDKPFVVGDFIVTGEHVGTVEKIGIKTTRLRALQGEEIVISNKELTSGRIQNFKKMERRRIVFSLGVTYDTPLKKLKKVPEIIKEIIDKKKTAELDRVHFSRFNEFSLDFEIVYYISSPDYSEYMDNHQEILFEIKEIFEKNEISMAFPTQTIIVNKEKITAKK